MENEIKKKTNKIVPKKPKKITRKKRKITTENFPQGGGKKPRLLRHSKSYKKKSETSEVKIPKIKQVKVFTEEERKLRSEKSKQYWENLRKNDPEKFAERIAKLQESRNKKMRDKVIEKIVENDSIKSEKNKAPKVDITQIKIDEPKIESSDDKIGKIVTDLEDKNDEAEIFINKITGEVFDNFKEWQESLANIPSYDAFKSDENAIPIWDDLVISNFLVDVYSRPTLNGSRFILNWVDTLIAEYGKPLVAHMIEFAKSEGYEIDVKMLYEEDKSSAMATGFMQFWYKKGFFAEDETIKDRYDPMIKIRKKMDKEFQGSQYTFGSSLMKAIEGDINADEVMQNYD